LKAELRNAIWLGIKEACLERHRRNELASKVDDQITRLAAAQLITEERLQAFLSRLRPETVIPRSSLPSDPSWAETFPFNLE